MKATTCTNPILPAAGVRRNQAAYSGGLLDDWAPNPAQRGRAQSNHSPLSNAFLRCKRPLIMAPFNANTVREDAWLVELAQCVEERGVEILGVQEPGRVHTDLTIKYQRVGGCTFITSSAWRNDPQAATGGVGFMVSPRAREAL